jgi:hypothetical protein
MNPTTEKSFEAYIEETLHDKNHWQKPDVKLWDKENALFPDAMVFIRDTQPKLYGELV